MNFVGGIAGPTIEGVVEKHSGFELLKIVSYMRERPNDAASSPGASGDNSCHKQIAARDITPGPCSCLDDLMRQAQYDKARHDNDGLTPSLLIAFDS